MIGASASARRARSSRVFSVMAAVSAFTAASGCRAGKMDQPLDAMWLRAIGRELDRDRDVLGCAVERAVAQRRGRASQRDGFNAALRNEGIARHALPEQFDRAWQVAALQLREAVHIKRRRKERLHAGRLVQKTKVNKRRGWWRLILRGAPCVAGDEAVVGARGLLRRAGA